MALEAAVYQQDLFGHNNGTNKDLYPLLLESWSDSNDNFFPYLKLQDHNNHENSYSTINDFDPTNYFLDSQLVELDWHSYYYHHGINHESIISPSPLCTVNDLPSLNNYDHDCWGLISSSANHQPKAANESDGVPTEMVVRPKQRRRARAKKNKEEIENQRMTHIAVERNRRKQMNEYLNELRSLMPESYVQRGDQASIVGAAINFVKELEHNLQSLSAKKQMKENVNTDGSSSSSSLPFREFFSFPQFSSIGDNNNEDHTSSGSSISQQQQLANAGGVQGGWLGADVEVTMVESHAHLKIRLRRPPKQLSKLVSGLHSSRLSILHLNVTTADDGVVLYSFSLKVEDGSKLSSVDDIARAVYLLLGRIQEETNSI